MNWWGWWKARRALCPSATDEEETYEEKVLIVDEINRSKTYTTEKKTQRIDELLIFEEGNHRCPQHRTHGLHSKQNTHPVACFIVSIARGVQHNHSVFQHCWCVENVVCYRTIGVSPHKHKGCPAEELHQTYCPESGRSFNQQCEHIGRLRLLFAFCLLACVCRSIRSNLVIFVVELRRIFLYRQCGVDDTEDEDGCTTIEGIKSPCRAPFLVLLCCSLPTKWGLWGKDIPQDYLHCRGTIEWSKPLIFVLRSPCHPPSFWRVA